MPVKKRRTVLLICIVTVALHFICKQKLQNAPSNKGSKNQVISLESRLHSVLLSRSEDNIIFLASVDRGYVEMAFNLYFSSLMKLKLTNYLFVGSDAEACQMLSKHHIMCFDYIHDKDANTSSNFGSRAFRRKTHLKTKITLEALLLNLTVIITDVDIVFLKNPIPYLTCVDCDIMISSDVTEGNSGFYLARPSPGAITLHRDAWSRGQNSTGMSNQKVLNRLIHQMKKAKAIKVQSLNKDTFVNGKVFFEIGQRMFKGDYPCPDCIIVHNNWIVSKDAKIYRFKEYGLWEYDSNQYYTSQKRKYLSFGMPLDFGPERTQKEELNALRMAFIIAELLNRTLILPKFHCYGSKYVTKWRAKNPECTFGTFYHVSSLNKNFKDKYRENSFLSHPLVPPNIIKSVSPRYLIKSNISERYITNAPEDIRVITPVNMMTGLSVAEILNWFLDRNAEYSVLRFHSLYNKFDKRPEQDRKSIEMNVLESLKASNLRQYNAKRLRN